MLIYWINFILIVFMAFVNTVKKDKNLQFVSFAVIVLFNVAIGSLRSTSVGTDTGGYVKIMPGIVSQSIPMIIEYERDPFFWVVMKLLNYVSSSPILYFSFLAVTFWSLSAYIIKKHSPDIFIALLVFVSFRFSDFYMNAMRQGVAIAIILFSFKYIVEKKPVNFVVTVLIASLFHKSAMIFLPAYLLQFIRLDKIRWIIPFLLISFFVLRNLIFTHVFVHLISDSEQYSLYLNSDESHGILYFMLYLVSFLICYFFSLNIENNRVFNLLLNMIFLAVLFQTICLSNPAFNRIAIYFSQFFILIIPYVYKYMIPKVGETNAFMFWIAFLVGLYALGGPAPGVVPYSYFWEHKI